MGPGAQSDRTELARASATKRPRRRSIIGLIRESNKRETTDRYARGCGKSSKASRKEYGIISRYVL